jgi:AraC family transcriptional regulator, transcriptional activator of pobA
MIIRRLGPRRRCFTDPDNYSILWAAKGLKGISVDAKTIPSCENAIIFLAPGKIIHLDTGRSDELKGWILSFSREFFWEEHQLSNFNIRNIELFSLNGKIPQIALSPKIGERVNNIAEMINELMGSSIPNKEMGVASLLRTLLVYCDSSCNIQVNIESNNHEIHIVTQFKQLVSQHFMEIHQVSRYAEMMHISPKYLNQVVKRVMGVTAKSIIQEQLVIRACRDLKFSGESVKEISARLGFSEAEHFSNFFKKEVGCAPSAYRLN